MKQKYSLLLIGFLIAVGLACGGSSEEGPPRNSDVVNVVANTSLMPWLETVVSQFNSAEVETSAGRTVYVTLTGTDAGQALVDIGNGSNPDIWIPDDLVWVRALSQQGQSQYQADCVSVAESPLVIGMWRPAAESLGWPGRELGWLDIGSLAADSSAWAYYSGGQFGQSLRLGHTHPGLSASGSQTLLALVQAAQSKLDSINVSDIQSPIVQASVGAFESAVSTFSPNTANLAQTMSGRGIDYLGAAILYESDVLYYGQGEPGLVPIYPFEGTFMATHPACVNESGQVEAAKLFRDYLGQVESQTVAAGVGLRPVNPNVQPGSPLDEAHGVDLSRPGQIFPSPSVESLYAIQELWQSARKDVNLIMVIDVSGSMRGDKISNVRQAAIQFVGQMGDDDYLSILIFSNDVTLIANHLAVGQNRNQLIQLLGSLEASGDTALYDAIGDGANLLNETHSPAVTSALVVLSDGLDTYSFRYNQDTILPLVQNITLFTIGYGSDADERLLADLALQGNGNFYQGDVTSIAAIYEELSAAFGGNVGVGR